MNRQTINTFNRGINQDVSVNKYSNENFYWAQNFRIVSKEGLATGALNNIKGTLPKLNFGGEGSIKIIGYCLIRDTLITFVSTAEGGKIYKWDYSSSDYEESPVLIYYDPNLDFRVDYPIRAVGRYENANTQKIYFTDGDTFFRHLNIIPQDGESYPLNLHRDLDSLDLVSDVSFSTMSLEIQTGGNLKAGKVQYAYQLYSVRGSETVVSPASQLIHLTSSSEGTSSFNYYGDEAGTIINKSVSVTIDSIDSLFTRMRLIALDYTVLHQPPVIRIVGEYDVENLTSITVVDTGTSIGDLTTEEFRFIQNNFYPKSIDIKDDYLFAANIKNDYFVITDAEFDARAFRANSSDQIVVYNGNNTVNVPYPFSTLPAVTEEQFNKFNDINNDYVGHLASNDSIAYKYKPGSAGATLGGAGVNISYEFTTNQVVLDDSPRVNSWGDGYPQLSVGASAPFANHAAPDSVIGYHRDEIYRFGIVFFDGKGRQSFVKWIGDIRFPNNREMPYIEWDSGNNRVLANILGIQFTVNIPAGVADKISGYQIVRAERTSTDRTILGQGIVGYPIATNLSSDITHLFSLATNPTIKDHVFEYSTTLRQTTNFGVISGEDPYQQVQPAVYLNSGYLTFESPEVVFNKPDLPTANAFVDVFGFQNQVENCAIAGEQGYEGGSAGLTQNRDVIVADKPRDFNIGSSTVRVKSDISDYRIFTPKPVGLGGSVDDDATKVILDGGQIYNNQAFAPIDGSTATGSKWGLRGTHALLTIDNRLPLDNNWWDDADPIRFPMANYKIKRGRAIYGGSSYEARTNTRYYSASEFVDKATSVVSVYGGDTYISYFVYARALYDNQVRVDGDRIETYMFYPVETSINLNVRLDRLQDYINWGLYRDGGVTDYKVMETASLGVTTYGTDYPTELGDLYRYNSAYSCTDKSKEYIPEPFDFQENLTQDTRIYASERKINGEYIDSWTQFKFNNYIDVDSKHHAITRIITFKNNLFYIQPTAVGIASVNARSLIQDNQPGELALGTGGILTRYDYVTDKSGSEFYDGIIASDNFLFYADGRRKRINKLVPGKEEAISLIKGIDSTLDVKSFDTVVAGFDKGYNEVVFCIDGDLTMAFNETLDAFTSSYTYYPSLMISVNKDFFSVGSLEDDTPWLVNDIPEKVGYIGDSDSDPEWDYVLIGGSTDGQTLFKHNSGDPGQFYGGGGIASDSTITLIINPNGTAVNSYDIMDFRTEATDVSGNDIVDEIFYRLEANNAYQTLTRELSFTHNTNEHTGTIKRIGRVWRTPLMPVQTAGGDARRMVDTYIKVTLKYNNGNGYNFRVHDITTYYRTKRN